MTPAQVVAEFNDGHVADDNEAVEREKDRLAKQKQGRILRKIALQQGVSLDDLGFIAISDLAAYVQRETGMSVDEKMLREAVDAV
jgi:RNA:NAD 2'-phosphotransferase (TPT1/KptA family)